MNIEDAVETLKKHNEWRRYDGDIHKSPKMVSGIELGIAIDTAIQAIESNLQNKSDRYFMKIDVECESCGHCLIVEIENESAGECSEHEISCPACRTVTFFEINYEPISNNLYCK